MNRRRLITFTLALPIALAAGLAGCCPSRAKAVYRAPVTYRIPPEKQEAAARLTAQLVESLKDKGYSPSSIMGSATEQVMLIYGEPVTVPATEEKS